MRACSAERTGVQIHKMRLLACMQWDWQSRCRGWETDIWTLRVWVFMLSQSFEGGVGETTVPAEVLRASSSLAPTFPFSRVSSFPPLLRLREKQRRPLWVQGPVVTCFEITTTACQVLGGREGRVGQSNSFRMPVRPATGLLSGFSGSFPLLVIIPCQKWRDKHRKSKSQPTLCQILLKIVFMTHKSLPPFSSCPLLLWQFVIKS